MCVGGGGGGGRGAQGNKAVSKLDTSAVKRLNLHYNYNYYYYLFVYSFLQYIKFPTK